MGPIEEERGRELTLRGLALGCAITLIFTAANVYLGLKVGLTFATSIPAAVISMALLRLAKGSTIWENNIVQTVASAAGAMGSIIFVLPGLVMMGWWKHGFPFWPSFLLCATGGVLGVLLSIPLRRALVTGSDLPYPEGVAAAEVLKVGSTTREGDAENRLGLRAVVTGSIVAAVFPALVATKLVGGHIERWFRVGGGATGITVDLLFALVGVGHLVGISVGIATFVGAVFAFGFATPLMVWFEHVGGPAADAAQDVWRHQVRFIGAGVIGMAAIWTLLTLMAPIWRGLREAAAASKLRRTSEAALPIEERDLPVSLLGFGTLALAVPIVALLWSFLAEGPLAHLALPIAVAGLVYVLVVSVFVSSVCGYMAGLIGSSNSPLSGIGILAVVGASLLLAIGVLPAVGHGAVPQLTALALYTTAIIFAAATIANDNLQDLKTGQLIAASPAKQQIALMVGTVAGSLMIPPVLDLLDKAYGFAGTIGQVRTTALPAPQATLITALAQGVLGAGLDWSLIGSGAAIGILLIGIDALLGRAGKMRLPPLAVGIGIYLPLSATLAVSVGALIGHLWEKRHRDAATRRIGVLLASGFIVGESLFGVALAALIVATGKDEPLALVGDGFATPAAIIGLALFGAALALLYRWAGRAGERLGVLV
ncbi:MAG: oligopeptide transporter, OPT family [Sphingomonadaceae bacterium]|nr:oligopeptide transporter, OPT family [Sphingomonadaceae bacterium]